MAPAPPVDLSGTWFGVIGQGSGGGRALRVTWTATQDGSTASGPASVLTYLYYIVGHGESIVRETVPAFVPVTRHKTARLNSRTSQAHAAMDERFLFRNCGRTFATSRQ